MHVPSWNIGCGALLLMVAVQLIVDIIRALDELWAWNFKGTFHVFNMLLALLRYAVGLT